jgi:hypothetical protein
MARPEFVGAFEHCPWCSGRGCNQCTAERQKWNKARSGPDGLPQPLFTAMTDNPDDMELLKSVAGREALEHAFGPGGGGLAEIEERAAEARVIQAIHQCFKGTDDARMPANEQQRQDGTPDAGSSQ